MRNCTQLLLFAMFCAHTSASSFIQDFSGTIRPTGNFDGIGLGAPFDGSQTGQSFTGSFAVSDLVVTGAGGLGALKSFLANGPSTLIIQFPTRSFVATGTAYMDFYFLSNTVTFDADIQPSGPSGPGYHLVIEASANSQFLASGSPSDLPFSIGPGIPGAFIFGEFSETIGAPSIANLIFSNLTPGTPVPEPGTGAQMGVCFTLLIVLLVNNLLPVKPLLLKHSADIIHHFLQTTDINIRL